MAHFDVLVIGAGTAGLTVARLVSRAGKQVALVERDRPGGDCLWTGCVPTKTLVEVARVLHEATHSSQMGITVPDAYLDWDAVRRHVTNAQEVAGRPDTEATIANWGTTFLRGSARFTSPHAVDVDGERHTASAFVIATGGEPAVPPIPGLEDAGFDTNVEAVAWESLPDSLAIIGGGAIGIEFAQMTARLGVRTTVIEAEERLLPSEDAEASAVIEHILAEEGVEVHTGVSVERVERQGLQRVVHAAGRTVTAERILVATGRRPVVQGLGLEAARLRMHRGRPVLDNRLRTSQPHIYAAGDVADGPQFTHVAEAQGRLVANVLLGKRFQSWSGDIVPHVTFSDPEVASVGLTEAQAKRRYGAKATTWRVELDEVDRAVTMGRTDGFLKVTTGPGWNRFVPGLRGLMGDTIVGATIVAPNAGELLMPIVVAMRARLPQGIIAWNIQAYPTMSLGLRQVLGARFDN
ncbi:MAG: FAD-dependent oxidoreductase [Dehalococcoidia bacterium]|nr:FAD-dependent oxidoreductase [Dehalococcoidia bacterium]